MSRNLEIVLDYLKLLQENSLKEEDVDRLINSPEFDAKVGEVIPEDTDLYCLKKSPIHKKGIFTTKKIMKGSVIGYALKDGYRTLLGRYTNHSPFNNTIFVEEGRNMKAIATEDININEEIVVNYRNHTYGNK
jgi:hypothetical protein